MKFEWDENKNKRNRQKHGIGFEDAKEVFKDEKRVEYQDLRHDYGEDRWKTIGQVVGIILSVMYTMRQTTQSDWFLQGEPAGMNGRSTKTSKIAYIWIL